VLKLDALETNHSFPEWCRRPSQKVKVLKQGISLRTPTQGCIPRRRPSQKVKVLKLESRRLDFKEVLKSQTFPEGKGVETGQPSEPPIRQY